MIRYTIWYTSKSLHVYLWDDNLADIYWPSRIIFDISHLFDLSRSDIVRYWLTHWDLFPSQFNKEKLQGKRELWGKWCLLNDSACWESDMLLCVDKLPCQNERTIPFVKVYNLNSQHPSISILFPSKLTREQIICYIDTGMTRHRKIWRHGHGTYFGVS